MKKIFVFYFCFSLINNVFAGHSEGNGGDHVRATFIKMGQAILEFLRDSSEGQQIVQNHELDLKALEESLTIKTLKTQDAVLIDNGGARVDALGAPGSIILHISSWAQHFEQERDVYYLVLHEMLRAIAKNDDNYVISKSINPFPISRKIATRINPVNPLIANDSLKETINTEKIALAGSGCPSKQLGTVAEFDNERNILDIFLRRYDVHTSFLKKMIDRKSCSLAIPIKGLKGKRVVISLLDVQGQIESKGAYGQISFESFLAGEAGEVIKREFNGEVKGGILLRRTNVLKSACGEDAILRVNTSVLGSSYRSKNKMDLELKRISAYFSLEDCS